MTLFDWMLMLICFIVFFSGVLGGFLAGFCLSEKDKEIKSLIEDFRETIKGFMRKLPKKQDKKPIYYKDPWEAGDG